jgi:hypothetical protein
MLNGKGRERKRLWSTYNYYYIIFLGNMSKTTHLCSGQELNLELPERKDEVPTDQPV